MKGGIPMKPSSFIFVFFFLLAVNAIECSADTSYTVRKGDSLHKIAKAFKVDVEKISEANRLDSSRLRPGTKLTIPSGGEAVKKGAPSSGNTASKSASDVNPQERKESLSPDDRYYTVRKGDSLASISRRYSISIGELKELNNIRNAKRLTTGQRLIVKQMGPKTYTVKKGDNIWKIAKKFNVSVADIEELNALESEDLRPGQKLLIEEWTERPEAKNAYSPIISQAKIAEDLKVLSESPELDALSMKERVTLFAKKMLNIPYKFGGSSFMGIDCSGYVQKVFGFLDVPLPRSAREQFHIGEPVSKEDLSIGDLVFFRTYASFPSHVGIYLGNNLFIHASSKGKKVTIDSLDTPYYIRRFIGAKRLIPDQEEKGEPKKEG